MDLIYFDLNGVILKNPSLVKHGLYPFISKYCEYEKVKENYNEYRINLISHDKFWEKLNVPNYKILEKQFFETLVPFDDIFRICKKLKEKYQLGILSNMPKEWYEFVEKTYKLKEYFNSAIVSAYTKTAKPDKNIYETAMNKVKAKKVYFVDDRLENLKPAAEVGIKTVWIKLKEQEFDFKPDYTIKSIEELESIFI